MDAVEAGVVTYRFAFAPETTGLAIHLEGPSGRVPFDAWALQATDTLLPGVDLAKRLEAAELAIGDGDTLLVEHRAVASLTAVEAKKLGLPPLADAVAAVVARGVITHPSFRVDVEWQRATGQPIVGPERVGALIRVGQSWFRVPDALFAIAEAAAKIAALPDDAAARFAAHAELQELLPAALSRGEASAAGMVSRIVIAVADAFSLDLVGEGHAMRLVPILHRAGGEPDVPLLAEAQQTEFGDKQFNGFGVVRPVYALGAGHYVVLQPILRQALGVVRETHGAQISVKRALMANPRAFLKDVLGDEADEVALEKVFRETPAYSDRVLGLGLWVPRVLPWVAVAGTQWFGEDNAPRFAESSGIQVGDQRIPLDAEQAAELAMRVEHAIRLQELAVPFVHEGVTVQVPASAATMEALARLSEARERPRPEEKPARTEREVLLIAPNEEDLAAEVGFASPRPSPPSGPPDCLSTPLKQHQREGLSWLQAAWTRGRPGVLLADDMGLGKTLQGLAFLAWLREGMASDTIEQAPLLIVAPTGLLRNWRAEHDRHLRGKGLGACTEAYGAGLGRLKKQAPDRRPSLDTEALERSDWVLTTYETLRDFDRDFGGVRWGALLFDEAQKIKTPGVRITDAAKAMNAEFRVALTGTPVENRLADLWCITDAVQPGLLGDLKQFSNTYERHPDTDTLRGLKSLLEADHGGRPRVMLRRMKHDRLPDLPVPKEEVTVKAMPRGQLATYEEAVDIARTARAPGAVLKALQLLRSISLHPDVEADGDDQSFIAASARLIACVEALDTVAQAGEKALVFLADLALQARLAGLFQRRYRLPAPPVIINGSVDGARRQAHVDAFQASVDGFGLMILSPQAGGVGLTLTRANHVIHLSRWWNPAVEDQCTGRVLRIGQTRDVHVHIPMAVLGDGRRAFDENLDALLRRKRQLMRDTLMPTDATPADQDELFRSTVGG